jgi:hypothetical protein
LGRFQHSSTQQLPPPNPAESRSGAVYEIRDG